MIRRTLHDQLWRRHPGVRTGEQLTRSERTADHEIRPRHVDCAHRHGILLIGMGFFIGSWIILNIHLGSFGHQFDPYPWTLLNLLLFTLAGLQCFVWLIANRRGEQVSSELTQLTEDHTEIIQALLTDNRRLPMPSMS